MKWRWLSAALVLCVAGCKAPPPEPVKIEVIPPLPATSAAVPLSPLPVVIVPASKPSLISTNVGKLVSLRGMNFLLDNEISCSTTNHKAYDRLYVHPEWPEGDSGITTGVGYDWGYEETYAFDWDPVLTAQDYADLKATTGLTGQAAKNRLKDVAHVITTWDQAYAVFDLKQLPREYIKTARMFPGMQVLTLNAQSALLSLEYNRGTSMVGPSRVEMRAIRDLVPQADYQGMALQFVKMIRIWKGSSIEEDMTSRRRGESKLLLAPDDE